MIIEIKNTNKIVKLFFVSIFLTLALVVSVLIAHASTVPDPPTNLQATPQSGGASMSWTAPANDGGSPLTGYELSYRAGATGAFTDYNLSNGDATATTAVVTGLTNNTAYEFRVSAINAVGTSSPSSSKYFTPGTIGLFESFSTTTINTSRWTERDTAGAGGSIGNVQQNGSALTIVGNGNAGTNGLTSINTFDRTQGDLYIDADITDSNCGLSGTTMALGYGDPVYTSSTSTSYVVAITNGVVKMQYYINGTKNKDNTTSFTCTTNTPFHISLRVLQTSGAQVFINGSSTILAQANAGTMSNKSVFLDSFSASATTTLDNLSVIAPSTAPGAPTNLSATAGDGQVSLSWSAPGSIGGSAITSYEVKYKSQTDFGYNTTINTMSTNTSTTVTGLTNGARYYFVVLADNNSGAGATSTSVGSFPVATSSQSPTIATTTIEGTARVGEKLMGAYTFLDPNRDLEATSTYQWFTSTTLNGTYTPISSATSQTYQATSTDLNNYLKFQVTPVSMNSPAIGTTATSGAVQVLGSQSYINDILTTGQSLGAGLGGSPALTTSQPYSNKRLDPSDTNFIALVEANQETIDSAEGNFLTATSSGQTFQDVVTNASVSGADYAQIKKGTATYTRTITQATSAYNDAPALGKVSRVIGMNVLHGGTDDSEGFTPVYDSYLDEWQRNFNTDLQAVTGQRANIPFFLEQNSSFTVYNGGAAEATSSMPKVQLDIALYNPTRYVMVAPDYMLVRNTNIPIHFTNVGYRKMGEYYGKVLNQVLVNRKPWIPLVPVSIKRNANIIYAKFHVPVAPLVLDTSLITAQTNYGFEYSDDSSSASISSVSLLNADTVKITLSTTPSGTNQRLRYAYTGTVGATPGPDNPSGSSPGSVRGNLRDSDTSTSTATFSSGEPLYDWAMSFDEPIFSATTAPIFSNISATGSTTATTTVATTTVSWNTDLGASTQIQFGPTSIYLASSTVTDTTAVGQLNHSVNINNLISCSVYHYQVLSTDILAQNSATSSDNTLATSGCPGQAAILASSTAYIDSTSGGSLALVTATSSASTTAPASFGTSAYFQIKQIPESIAVATTSLPAGLVAVGTNFYDIKALTNSTTTENSFAQPISVTLSYNDSDLTNANVSTSTLTLKRWDGITWNDLSSCSTNTVTKNVTCSTSNFSTFGMFGESTTPDVTPPVISNVASSTSDTSATITWDTNEAATSTVNYGLNTSYGTASSSSALVTSHSISLSSLSPGTLYHFQVSSADASGNLATSSDYTFLTSTTPDVTPPVISNVASSTSDTSATITWDTNEAATSTVNYGLNTSYGTASSSSALVTSHSISLSSLSPGTLYHFQVSSADASGNLATSSDYTFLTSTTPDVTPPVISNVASSTSDTSATITWDTNEAATSTVNYGLNTSYGTASSSSALVTSHSISLSSLSPGTLYHFQVSSADASGNLATSSDYTFLTSTTPDVTPPVISNVASSTSDTSATITWDTNEAATSTVNYGLNTSYGTASSSSALVTSHSISLSSLSPGTLYHFQVSSADASGNLATSSDYTFLTSTTPDVTPPVISNVASSTSDTSATITWDTNEAATSTVNYGLNTSYGTASSSSALVTSHSISLSSLSPGTLYHFQVSSADASGNLATSSDYTFLTSTTPDVTPPVISNVASSTSDTSATITWDTNEAATSTVNYGLNTSYGTASSSSALVTSHSISLSSLSPGTLYHFQVSSADASGNLATSSDYTFLTSTTPDVTPPVISNVASSTSDTSATITWDTNEAATSTVNYGLNTSYGTASSSSALVTSHSISLSSLSPGTLYHFQVSSADASGNLATSSDYTFLTSTTPDVTPPVISNVASSTSDTSATITWDTNEAATSTVNYGLNTSYGTASSSSALVTSHSISLSSLSPGTLYHFQVSSADASGNLATSSDYTFLTSTTPDVTPPVISNVASSTSDTSATITWDTNEAATSTVNYGLNTSYGTASSSSALVTSHSISLSSLSPGTLYHFQVSSADASGNLATSSDYTFLTSTTPDVTPPVISNVASSTSDTSATITWDTNEAATSTVNYGLNTSYGTASSSSALVTSHSISLSSLSPGTLYHFQVSSADASGNLATSSDYTFLTSTTGGGGGGGGGGSHGGGGGGSSGGETPPPIVPPFIPPSDCGPGDNFSASTGLPCGGSTTLPPPPVQTGIFTRDLTLGSTGADVISLQTILVAQGYLVIPPGVSMGYFGNLTQTALAEYQSAHNISPAIGYFGPITRGYLSSLQGGVSPTARYIFTISTNPGESNTDTLPLQKFLVSNGFLTGYFMPGVYDEATLRAVGSFQIFTGILNSPQDSGYGFIGPLTKSKLNSY